MSLVICLGALAFLMFVAYRGFSVILFAPFAALLAVLATSPAAVPTLFTALFMEKMVGFLKLYFPVFLLGAVFGKLVELAGLSSALVGGVIGLLGRARAMLAIVVVGALLTYGGVSLFVVVFAVYPFAVELFRRNDIPKRLIPATIALGAFTFTMDALPGTPQIQNIIPTTFFKTDAWAAPRLGLVGSAFILVVGMTLLEWRRRRAAASGEGYGTHHAQEPLPPPSDARLPHPLLALLPLVLVGVSNSVFTRLVPRVYGATSTVALTDAAQGHPVVQPIAPVAAIWAVEGALLVGIVAVIAIGFPVIRRTFVEGTRAAVAGALLASMNTASEYGFGAVIAALPGFLVIARGLDAVPNPLVHEALTVTTLAGVTGSASGGMSIALAAMADSFVAAASAAHVPVAVLHRVAAMASGGMDTLPHNGAVITLLAVTGLTHRQAYADVFALTLVKTAAVGVVIAVYYATGIV